MLDGGRGWPALVALRASAGGTCQGFEPMFETGWGFAEGIDSLSRSQGLSLSESGGFHLMSAEKREI